MDFYSTILDSSINTLVDSFIKLRQNKKQEELQTDDWKELEKAYYKHLQWRFSYPKKVFGQQKLISAAIGILVIVLVSSGIVFSFWQLHYALSMGDLDNLASDISIETAGKVTISSSILGSLVLVISLAFFSLYLKNVFRIEYPKPPHVGFEETDLKEFIKNKLIPDRKKKPAGTENNDFYKLMLQHYITNELNNKDKSLNDYIIKQWIYNKESNKKDKGDDDESGSEQK